jgi:gliding motility-associated protein GldM
VARPSLTVSAIKMNLLYMGVDNPVSISVPGVADNNLSATISTGTLRRDASGKNWVVRVSQQGKAIISVAMKSDKTTRSMGSAEFRVKRLPPPNAFISNVDGGPVAKNALIPRMPEDFEFDLNFVINSFTFISIRGGDVFPLQGKGNLLTEEMKNFIRNSKRGDKIWLENIMAKGPDGSTRRLGTISLEIK